MRTFQKIEFRPTTQDCQSASKAFEKRPYCFQFLVGGIRQYQINFDCGLGRFRVQSNNSIEGTTVLYNQKYCGNGDGFPWYTNSVKTKLLADRSVMLLIILH